MARRETDPLVGFNFLIESGGIIRAGFSECTGINAENDHIDYREGTDAMTARKLPGLTKFGAVTLKSGVAVDGDLFAWRKTVMDGDVQRRDMSIVILDEQRNEKLRYNLASAWPSKWTGPELKANASEVAVESLEICHEGVSLA